MSQNFFGMQSNRIIFYDFREPQGVLHQVWRHHRSHGHEGSHYTTVKVSFFMHIIAPCPTSLAYYRLINLGLDYVRFSIILLRNGERRMYFSEMSLDADRESVSGKTFSI